MSVVQELRPPASAQPAFGLTDADVLEQELAGFDEFGKQTIKEFLSVDGFGKVPVFIKPPVCTRFLTGLVSNHSFRVFLLSG